MEESPSTIDTPPQFTMRLRDRRVQMTYPVRLTCQAVGFPYPSVIWAKDGEIVKQDGKLNLKVILKLKILLFKPKIDTYSGTTIISTP